MISGVDHPVLRESGGGVEDALWVDERIAELIEAFAVPVDEMVAAAAFDPQVDPCFASAHHTIENMRVGRCRGLVLWPQPADCLFEVEQDP